MATPTEIQSAIETTNQYWIQVGLVRSCLNCDNWSLEKDRCSLFATKPPADVIVFSCKTHWEMTIPF